MSALNGHRPTQARAIARARKLLPRPALRIVVLHTPGHIPATESNGASRFDGEQRRALAVKVVVEALYQHWAAAKLKLWR